MATEKLSFTDYVADGNTTQFPITFDRIKDEHVFVEERNTGEPIPFTINGNNAVTDTPPTSDTVVRVGRKTPRDVRLAIYQDGSTLLATDLNTLSKQLLFVVQEAYDYADTNAEDAIGALLEDAEVAADEAENARDTAETYRNEAYQWTARAEDDEFTDSAGNTGYSARHWAQKAAASAEAADTWDPGNYVERVPSADRGYSLGRSDARYDGLFAASPSLYDGDGNLVLDTAFDGARWRVRCLSQLQLRTALNMGSRSTSNWDGIFYEDAGEDIFYFLGGGPDPDTTPPSDKTGTAAIAASRGYFGGQLVLKGGPGAESDPQVSFDVEGTGPRGFYPVGYNIIRASVNGLACFDIEEPGTSTSSNKTAITREKGDARYAKKEEASLFGDALKEWNVTAGTVYTNTSGHFQVVFVVLFDKQLAEMRTPGGDWFVVGGSGTDEASSCTLVVPPGAEYRFPGGVSNNHKRGVLT